MFVIDFLFYVVRDKVCRIYVGVEVFREEKISSLGSRYENVSKGNGGLLYWFRSCWVSV